MTEVLSDYEGNRHASAVPSWEAAMRMLTDELGIEVVDARVQPIVVLDWFTREPKSKGWIHCHFFGKDGREVAYWTECMKTMFVFKTPRTWDPGIFAGTTSPSEGGEACDYRK